jgi:16S rRNA processing protein RimM
MAVTETDDPDLLLIGRVARAHGNKGQVIVNLDTDFPEARFVAGTTVRLGSDAQPRKIEQVRFHTDGRPVISLEGIATMNDAEALAGAELKVVASDLPPLPEGTFYHHELIDCEVVDAKGRAIGRVASVEGSMEMSRLVIAGPKGEILIPLVSDICISIDTAQRRIVVQPPDGLLELNESAPR